jgi:hypothetical protein
MSEQVIKDASGRTIGFIRSTWAGGQQAFNVDRQLVGSYDARNDITKDAAGGLVAKGNTISSLLFRAPRRGWR